MPETNYGIEWKFEAYSKDKETQYIELINQIACHIENYANSSEQINRIKQYGLLRFNDIFVDEK